MHSKENRNPAYFLFAGSDISKLNIFILFRYRKQRTGDKLTMLKFVLARLQYRKRNRKLLAINDEFFFGHVKSFG